MSLSKSQGDDQNIEAQAGDADDRGVRNFLPTDKEEHSRLDIQNEAIKRIVGGLFFAPELIEGALTVKDGVMARIVDAGTGSGAWALAVAKERPECEVIGMDLVPPAFRSDHPRNVRFQAIDLNDPLGLETASVNVVHARSVDQGIKNYPKWLAEVARVLSPGGVYIVSQGCMTLVCENGDNLPTVPIGHEDYTGLQSIFTAMNKPVLDFWGGTFSADSWSTWIGENGNFENFGRTEVLLPIGAWKAGLDQDTQIAAELMRQNFLKIISSFKPNVMKAGYEEAVVDKWIADATLELVEMRVNVSARWPAAWAVRSDNKWNPYEGKQ